MSADRLKKQIDFIVEIDQAKNVFRKNVIIETKRNENDAEHSWHLAVMAMLLGEYAVGKNLDIDKVIKMVLIHDLVEIDAGDTFCYDEQAHQDKAERENKAAQRIFNILPSDQGQKIMDLWQEFEEQKTPEACFAAALDRLQPLLLNYHTQGHTWQIPGVNKEKVCTRNAILKKSTPELWEYVQNIIEDSLKKGYLKE